MDIFCHPRAVRCGARAAVAKRISSRRFKVNVSAVVCRGIEHPRFSGSAASRGAKGRGGGNGALGADRVIDQVN